MKKGVNLRILNSTKVCINRRWGDSPECGCDGSAERRLHSIQNVPPCAMKEGELSESGKFSFSFPPRMAIIIG